MSEENDVVVSQKDIDDVTREVLKKDEAEKQKIKDEARAELKKEMEEEAVKKKLMEDKAKLEAALVQKEKEKEEEIKRLKEEQEKLKEQIGQSKGLVNTENPFSQGKKDEHQELNLDELTPEQINEIDNASKEAFKDTLVGKKGVLGRDFKTW